MQNVSNMLGQNEGVRSPHQNKKKSLYQYMSANSFRSTAQQSVDFTSTDFYLRGPLKPWCIHLQLKMKTLHQCILMPFKPFTTELPQSMIRCRQACIDSSGGTLSICCEL
jgi:hypothetical protein